MPVGHRLASPKLERPGEYARPLQLATLVGFTFTALGIGVAVLVLVNYIIRGGTVPGFTFLASIVAIFAGAQLFALGIIGEYLARMHFRVMNRPTYTIRSSTPTSAAEE